MFQKPLNNAPLYIQMLYQINPVPYAICIVVKFFLMQVVRLAAPQRYCSTLDKVILVIF